MKRAVIILLLAGLITSFFYFAFRKKPDAALEPAPELLTLLPKDVTGVAYLDLAAIRASQFWREAGGAIPAPQRDADFQRFVTETGFDYERDLDRVAVAWRSTNVPHGELPAIAIAEGRFDRAKIRAYATRNGKVENASGTEIFRFVQNEKQPRDGEEVMLLAFLSDTRIVLAETTPANQARFLAFVQSPPAAQPFPEKVQQQLQGVAGAALFAVARVVPASRNASQPGWNFAPLQQMQGVDWMTIAARPEHDRLRLQIEAEAAGTLKAMQLGVLLDGFKMMITAALRNPSTENGLSQKENDVLLKLVEAARTARDGNRLQVRMELTPELVRILAARAQREAQEERRSDSPEQPRSR